MYIRLQIYICMCMYIYIYIYIYKHIHIVCVSVSVCEPNQGHVPARSLQDHHTYYVTSSCAIQVTSPLEPFKTEGPGFGANSCEARLFSFLSQMQVCAAVAGENRKKEK